MASSIARTIEVIFQGTDKMSGVMGNISGEVSKFGSSIDAIAAPLAGVADSVLKVDAAIAALVAGGMAVAVIQAGKFGDSFAEISTLTNATGEDLDSFREDIIKYSKDSTASIDDINASVYTAISAGTEYSESLDLLKTSEQLSIAGRADLESTTRVLVSTLNAYGKGTEDATEFSDALFTTIRLGQTTLPELAQSLGQVTAIAASSGVPFDTLSAAIAALTAYGVNTPQAMTSIKAAIQAIIKPTEEASKLAEKLGIQFDASALASKGFEGILQDVYESTGGATEQIVELFGSIESLPAVMNLGKDVSKKFADALVDMENKTGATAVAYDKMADNFKLTNQNLANNVNATFIQIGTKLLDSYSGTVAELTDIFKSVGVGIDANAFEPLFDAIENVGGDIVEFLDALGKSIPEALEGIDWSGFISSLGELGNSFTDMFQGFDPADPESVRKAIQYVIDSVESLIVVTKGMVDSFKPFVEGILNSVAAFNQLDEADKESAGNILGLAKAVTTLGKGLTVLLLLIGDTARDIETVFNIVIGAIEMLWGGFKVSIQGITMFVLASIDKILKALEGVAWGDWNTRVKDMRVGVQKELKELEERFDASVDQVNFGLKRIATSDIDIPPVVISAETEQMTSDIAAINALVEAMKNEIEAPIVVGIDSGGFDGLEELQIEWEDFDWDVAATISTVDDFDGKLEQWENTAEGISNFPISIETAMMFKWTDASGGVHVTDQAPQPDEFIGTVSTLSVPIDTVLDKPKAELTQKELKEVLTKEIREDVSKELSAEIKTGVEDALIGMELGLEIEARISTNFSQVNEALAIAQGAYDSYAGTVEAAYTSGAEIIAGASEAISNLAETFTNAEGLDKYKVEDWTDAQLELQDREMDLREKIAKQNEKHLERQEELTAAQIKALNKHRNVLEDYLDALTADGGVITLDIQGVEPEIELIMWKILKMIQVRANESGAEFLLAAAA